MNSRYDEAMNTPISETPRSRYSFAPGVIEGPDAHDFLKKDNALSALARYVVRPLLIAAATVVALYVAAGYIAAAFRLI